MAWIESHQSIARHPKTIRLARALGVSKSSAIGYLQLLWWWALDYAQDGDLSAYTVDEVEAGSEWEGEPGRFLDGLKQSGYVDPDNQLHDWYDYAGKLIEQRERDAERKREQREKAKEKKKKDVHRMSDGRPLDNRQTSTVRPDVPNQPTNLTNSTNQPNGQELKTLPTLDDESDMNLDTYCQEIEFQMVACGASPGYTARDEAYQWVLKFHKAQVPISFIRSGIVQAYAKKPDISTFTYCAKIIKDLWARELQKQQPIGAIEFEAGSREVAPAVDSNFLEEFGWSKGGA